ncbi:MAG: Sec-independent protein translocase protein TatB, partial [Hyphomonadaceae bacterium]
MMPGVGFEEMILLVIVAIVVIGPKDLPLMMRKFGRFTGKMRAMAFEFKQGIDELGRQAELDELRKEVADLKKATGLDEIRRDLEKDKADLERDVANVMRDTPTPSVHPAGETATAPEVKQIPDYAGLSADHPGYDNGEALAIDVPAPDPSPAPGAAEAEVHVIPDEEFRPAGTHPAASAWPAKQPAK